MKKRVLCICLCLVMSAPVVFADQETSLETAATSTITVKDDFSPQLIEKIKLQRDSIYNALNLTPSQIKAKDEIDAKRYKELEKPLRDMCLARKKVKDLADSKDCTIEQVNAAKKDFDNAKDEISRISNKYDKEFKKHLTSEQKSKFNMIRKLKKADMRKMQQVQKNGQKEGDLRPFGKPISQAAYAEEKKKQNSIWNKIKLCKRK